MRRLLLIPLLLLGTHVKDHVTGHYLLAVTILVMSQCERLGRKKISPYFSEKKWSLYGVTCMVTLHALGSYCTSAFFLRSMENVWDNWQSHYFWGHIACLLFYVVVSALPTPRKQYKAVGKHSPASVTREFSCKHKHPPSMPQDPVNEIYSHGDMSPQKYKLEMKYS